MVTGRSTTIYPIDNTNYIKILSIETYAFILERIHLII